jgi:hypothetical protein
MLDNPKNLKNPFDIPTNPFDYKLIVKDQSEYYRKSAWWLYFVDDFVNHLTLPLNDINDVGNLSSKLLDILKVAMNLQYIGLVRCRVVAIEFASNFQDIVNLYENRKNVDDSIDALLLNLNIDTNPWIKKLRDDIRELEKTVTNAHGVHKSHVATMNLIMDDVFAAPDQRIKDVSLTVDLKTFLTSLYEICKFRYPTITAKSVIVAPSPIIVPPPVVAFFSYKLDNDEINYLKTLLSDVYTVRVLFIRYLRQIFCLTFVRMQEIT